MRNPILSSRKFEGLAQPGLESGEQLIWAGEESPASRYFKIAVAFIIGIVVGLPIFLGLFGSILHKSFAPIYVIGFFIPMIFIVYKQSSSFIVITDKRIIVFSKLDIKPLYWFPMEQVREIRVKQTAEECGDLIFVFKTPLRPDKPNGKKAPNMLSLFCIRGINQADRLRDSLTT